MNNEEHAIREAEIEPSSTASDSIPERQESASASREEKGSNSYLELALLLVLGLLVGVTVKQETSKSIVVGFDDYKMKLGNANYSINTLQEEVIKKRKESPEGQGSAQNILGGGNCSAR